MKSCVGFVNICLIVERTADISHREEAFRILFRTQQAAYNPVLGFYSHQRIKRVASE